MAIWKDYLATKEPHEHSVVGEVRILHDVHSPQLNNKREVLVYLPPSYNKSDKRYPVIYMHDGQNLFDNMTSFAGEWHVDAAMEALAQEGLEAIIVGLYNKGNERIAEYNPYYDQRFGQGKGEKYIRFITDTVKPMIDSDFRTCRERQHTGIAGSSMGGLISLYGFFHHGHVFGFAGIFSPALWLASAEAIRDVMDSAYVPGKIYLDIGTKEMSPRANTIVARRGSQSYCASPRCLNQLLIDKGYEPDHNLMYVEEKGGRHEEAAWARRAPAAMRFLLSR